ncbi:MAG TPA: hypothetical protein VJ617_02445 [Arthrobacter sp.]|nr:hypothetical protein [Arthrobacter sp.]
MRNPRISTAAAACWKLALFNVYAVLLLAVSAAFVFTIPETKGKDLTH